MRTVKFPKCKNKYPAWNHIEVMAEALRKTRLLSLVKGKDLFAKEADTMKPVMVNSKLSTSIIVEK